MSQIKYYAAFNQGMYCLQRQNRSSEKEIQYFLELITCKCKDKEVLLNVAYNVTDNISS